MTIYNNTQATLSLTSDSTLELPTINNHSLKPRTDKLVS